MDAEVTREVEHLLGQRHRQRRHDGRTGVLVGGAGAQGVEAAGVVTPAVDPLGERVGVPG